MITNSRLDFVAI